MPNVKSLLAHRIRKSSALIAQVEPLVRSTVAAVQDRSIQDPLVVLADTMIWRRKLIVALAELDLSAMRMALANRDAGSSDDQQLLSALKAEMASLIDAVAALTAALLLPRQSDH